MMIPAEPRSANNRAVASPSPWVLPVMMAYLPSNEFRWDTKADLQKTFVYCLDNLDYY